MFYSFVVVVELVRESWIAISLVPSWICSKFEIFFQNNTFFSDFEINVNPISAKGATCRCIVYIIDTCLSTICFALTCNNVNIKRTNAHALTPLCMCSFVITKI